MPPIAVLVDASAELGDLLAMLAHTGVRWDELAAIRVRNVDLPHRRLVTVRDAAAHLTGKVWPTADLGPLHEEVTNSWAENLGEICG